jgi:hypothetical protein
MRLVRSIREFNTCSRVPTPRSLTDTGGGYHIENPRIATTLSPPFPSEGSIDPSNGYHIERPGLILSNINIQTKYESLSPIADTWPFNHSASTDIYVYA